MRAILQDRHGARRVSVGLGAAGLALAAAAAAWIAALNPASYGATAALFTGLAAVALALASPQRFAPRAATVSARPGEVAVAAGLRSLTLRPRDIRGATTTRHAHPDAEGGVGCAVSLSMAGRPLPVSLVFARAADAREVRIALGLEHGGRGETSWRTRERGLHPARRLVAWGAFGCLALAAAISFAFAFAIAPPRGEMPGPDLVLLGIFGLLGIGIAAVLGLATLDKAPEWRVALRPEGAYVPTPSGHAVVPYASITRVACGPSGRALEIDTHGLGRLVVESPLVPPVEVALLASHLEDARRRALGEGERRAEVEERLRALERAAEPVDAWLARLDALGATLHAGAGVGYRGAALDREDLRAAMEDADVSVELRAAAARVLSRVEPEVRSRVACLAETMASGVRARVLRVSVGEQGELAEALAELEEDAQPLGHALRTRPPPRHPWDDDSR